MTAMTFPKTPNFTGMFAPSGVEADVNSLPVIDGAVPEELDGAFYRVCPDPQFPPLSGDDIWFNGDGMITRFRFQGGNVSLRQKWARTEKFNMERAAGRALFGMYRNPLTDTEEAKGRVRSTANTNVVVHAGKLYALKEDSPPTLMDPETLDTIDPVYTFGGKMKSQTFTAHPKFDPKTGHMLAFGYAAKGLLGRDMVYYEIDTKGEIVKEVWFEIPYYCMMHDFGVTEDYAVFHVVPITSDWERLAARKPHFGFDTKKPVYLGVLPRGGGAEDLRWFSAPVCFASHVMNAHNDGTKIHFDVPMAEGNMFPFFPDIDDNPFDPQKAASRMTRWTVDLRSNSEDIQMEPLSDLVGEFPRIDDRFTGLKNRHGFLLVQDFSKPVDLPGGRSASGMLMNTLAHIDLETGEKDTYWLGPVSSLQEPAFVPRPGSTEEGDGYLVAIENRLDTQSSRLLLFEARHVAKGPIATLGIPFRIRPGLHGNWATAAQIAG
ncbi:carotenoid oxygenase family protein [Sphingosinicella sp. CPCC 101087]|uniref:carotenoid oxygenase family protein n=1 Tax=Sphingosinicella sp. CPCC 101087 TaxID=2497754 RepID=UPI001FB05F59|nr:carotenoid oxygenase family protein [Sphingosinicella sp. CPCC 101087]